MADETDVENVLVGMIIDALYPNGRSQACIAGVPVNVVRGWPTTQAQDNAKAMSAAGKPGLVNVSVATRNGVERNTERYPLSWHTVVAPVHTLTMSVSTSNVITIGGTVSAPQNVIALIGGSASKRAFQYSVNASDTLALVAAGLASAIAVAFPGTTSTGPAITVNSGLPIIVRVVSSGMVLQEVGRSDKSFQITIWAPPCNVATSDADTWRTAVAKIIDPMLRGTVRIVLPDQTYANVNYERTITMDGAQAEGLYRRDLFYWVEYATTITQVGYEIGAAQSQLQAGPSPTGLPLPNTIPTETTNS